MFCISRARTIFYTEVMATAWTRTNCYADGKMPKIHTFCVAGLPQRGEADRASTSRRGCDDILTVIVVLAP